MKVPASKVPKEVDIPLQPGPMASGDPCDPICKEDREKEHQKAHITRQKSAPVW